MTSARIALGRAGGSLPTAELLRFALDHAEAQDAVHTELNVNKLTADLLPLGQPIVAVTSCVTDRSTYLRRPDLGRQLAEQSRALLASAAGKFDAVVILADGLSALATQQNAPALLANLLRSFIPRGIRLAPLVIATGARVVLADEIGQILGARASVILIGERPGLGSADSLGAYLTYHPHVGNTDADRNCVSNIRQQGLPTERAGELIDYLLAEILRRQLSGVQLKDERFAGNISE